MTMRNQPRRLHYPTMVVLVGVMIAWSGRISAAAPDPAVEACRKTCKQARVACNAQAQDALHALLGECTGSGAGRKQCRRQAKDTTHAAKAACNDFRRTCLACCTTGGGDCSARCGDRLVTATRGEGCDPPGSTCGAG